MRHTIFVHLLAFCLLPITEGGGLYAPLFQYSSYQTRIPSTTAIGSAVLTVNAVDFDPGDRVYYSIKSFPLDSYVTIDENTGVIRVVKNLQILTVSQLAFTVQARDRQDPNDPDVAVGEAQVTIHIVSPN